MWLEYSIQQCFLVCHHFYGWTKTQKYLVSQKPLGVKWGALTPDSFKVVFYSWRWKYRNLSLNVEFGFYQKDIHNLDKIFTLCVSFLFLYIWLYCVFRWLTKIAMLKRRNRHLVVFPRNVCPDLDTVRYYLPTLWARCIQGWVWRKLVNEVTTVPRNPSPIVWKSTESGSTPWVHSV